MKALKQLLHPVLAIPRHELALAVLRIGAGAFFLYIGYQKLINPDFAPTLPTTLKVWMEANPYPFYKGFLEHIAVPNAGLLAPMVQFGEVFIGLSYITGFLVPVSALAALFMNLNFYLATQHTGAASGGINIAFMLISFALFWSKAGHYYGLDYFVFREEDKPAKKKAEPPRRVASSGKKADKQAAKIESAFKNAKAATKPGKSKKSKPKNKPF